MCKCTSAWTFIFRIAVNNKYSHGAARWGCILDHGRRAADDECADDGAHNHGSDTPNCGTAQYDDDYTYDDNDTQVLAALSEFRTILD